MGCARRITLDGRPMNTRAKATTEHVERVRATGEEYLKNQADFPRVVLAYGRALLAARKACGDDDTAFGKGLAAHHLDRAKNDRSALINLAKHSKVAIKVLRETTSRSVRLIWENEVRPKACPVTYPNAGTGGRYAGLVPTGRKVTVQVEHRTYEIRVPRYDGPTRSIPLFPQPPERDGREPISITRTPAPEQPVAVLTERDIAAARRQQLATNVVSRLLHLAGDIEHARPARPGDLDAIVEKLLHDEPVPQFPMSPAKRDERVRDVMAALDFAVELRPRLQAALEQRTAEADAKPNLKMVAR